MTPSIAGTWRTNNGEEMNGSAVYFNFETKTVTLEESGTGEQFDLNSQDLDFPSKRILLFSPVFHGSFPEGAIWPREKFGLFGLAILSPVILLITGMWLAGLFIARRFNPFSAVGAFLGSWIAGVILVTCYLVFAERSNLGTGLLIAGIAIATLVMAMFISAMYRTKFLNGILIFVLHIVFASLLGYILLYGMDKFIPIADVNALWDRWVFEPTGLVSGAPRTGY